MKRLNLSGNRFLQPPGSLQYCKSLEFLNLDENPFEILNSSSAFPAMPSLKELSLCCMPHVTFVGPKVFSELTALERLSLQNCPRLKEINENALVKQVRAATRSMRLNCISGDFDYFFLDQRRRHMAAAAEPQALRQFSTLSARWSRGTLGSSQEIGHNEQRMELRLRQSISG